MAALLIGVALAAPADAGAATLSGADGDVWNAADPAPTYTVTATRGSRVEWLLEGRGDDQEEAEDARDPARRSFRVDTAAALAVSYAVAPAPAAAPTGLRRLASNHRRLSPALGSRLSTLRPLLRWPPRARARL